MANPIDLVITQDALKAIDAAIVKVNTLDKELAQTAQNFIDNSKKMANAINSITPTSVNNKATDSAKISADLDKLKTKYVAVNDAIQKKIEQTRLIEIRLQQQREKAFDTFDKNAKKEEAILKKQETAYQRIQNSVNLLTKTYQDLAIRKELGNTLSAKEEKQLESVSKRINVYQDALKKVDSQIGKNGRHVGDYARQYNGLGNAVNQITREAPAGAVSLNTFFLAISNNLPMLFDELGKIREQNIALTAEGKQGTSVIKQLAGAFFSWGTALSLGVTLLTLYGGKLAEMAFGLGNVEAQLKKVEAQQARYNSQLEDANRNIEHNLILEKNRRKLLGETEADLIGLDKEAAMQKLKNYEITRDANKKLLDLEVKRISDQKGFSIVEFNDEINAKEKLTAEKIRLEKKLGKELVKQTYLARTDQEKADVESLAKTNNKLLVLETLSQDEIYNKRKEGYVKANNEAILYGQKVSELFSNLALQEQDSEEDRLANLAEMNKKEIELLIAKNDILLNDEESYYSDRFSALNTDFRLRKRLAELDRDEELRLAKNSYEKRQTALLNFQIANLELLQNYSKKRAEIEKLDLDPIRDLLKNDWKKDLMKPVEDSAKKAGKELENVGKKAEKTEAALLKLQATTGAWLRSFSSDVFQNSGFRSLETFFDGTFKNLLKGAENSKERFAVYFNAIAESAQEAFNFITSASQDNFDNEKDRLQSQYDIALEYAGDNKAAQEKLAKDLEKQKKEIANREAKAKKEQAIFNIAMDTAQGIIGVWANPGFPAAIPLAIAIGVLGAAQIAMVSAQKIPQYWMGGTHEGGLMMVNDGGGSNYKETVVTPDGKIMKPQGKNVIMNAPAGTEIYTNNQWNDKLAEMLQGKGIDMAPVINNNSGLSKSDMYDVMMDAFGSQPQHVSNFDAQGATEYITRNGNKTILNRNRSNGKGQRFR